MPRQPFAPDLSCFAVAAPGLEPIVASELAALGLPARIVEGGAEFDGPPAALYAANLHLRCATRVLVRIGAFPATAFYELEKRGRKLNWESVLTPGRPVSFRVSARASRLYHERAIEERLLAAVERLGAVPAPPALEEEEGERSQLFVVRVLHDRILVSADASGAALHRRGYRQAVAKAPLRETLAAAMLRASGWDGRAPLLDPFCGSGTIPIEAALLARGIPPGLAATGLEARAFSFERWPDFDAGLWQRILEEARAGVRPAPGPVLGSDRDAGAVAATCANARRAGVLDDIETAQRPLSRAQIPPTPGWLVTNPPYGRRIGEADALRDLYAALGRLAHGRLPGWTLTLLAADRRLAGQLRLPLRELLRTRNGGIPVRLLSGRIGD